MELINEINKIKGLMDFVQYFFLFCPNHPTECEMTDVDLMKMIFCRYSKRSMYYAENFVNNLNKIGEDLKARYRKESNDYLTQISDDIFFDFDAFIFSCKSILEGRIIKLSRGFHPEVKRDFEKYTNSCYNNFVKLKLTPIRNEVIHLNKYGSAMSSLAWIKNGEINIRAFDYSDNFELTNVFTQILGEMIVIINNIARFIMLHECKTWGFPEKDLTFSSGLYEYKISDYIESSNL